MTDCNKQTIRFSSLKNKKISADFNGGTLTSDAGVLLLWEVDKHIALIDAIDKCIPDQRNPFFTVHQQRTMLAQRIFGIAVGYEDLNDHQSLRDDPLFQIISERGIKDNLPLASPPTLCRLENRIDRKTLSEIAKVFVEIFIASYITPPDTLVGIFAAKKNWMSFLAFLKWLRRRYPSNEVLHVVLDNAGYHLKAEVLMYAARHKIKFYRTPTNASWLNRIESHFTALRKFALDNTDYRSHQEQQEAIECYLSWRNRTRDISLEDWKPYRHSQKKVA